MNLRPAWLTAGIVLVSCGSAFTIDDRDGGGMAADASAAGGSAGVASGGTGGGDGATGGAAGAPDSGGTSATGGAAGTSTGTTGGSGGTSTAGGGGGAAGSAGAAGSGGLGLGGTAGLGVGGGIIVPPGGGAGSGGSGGGATGVGGSAGASMGGGGSGGAVGGAGGQAGSAVTDAGMAEDASTDAGVDPAACDGPGQCVAMYRNCCPSCSMPDIRSYEAINSQYQATYKPAGCSATQFCLACANGAVNNPNIGAMCVRNHCELFDVRAVAEFSGCTTDTDCLVRQSVTCCGCGAYVGVSNKGNSVLAAAVCSPRSLCRICPAVPAGMTATCGKQGACVVPPPP